MSTRRPPLTQPDRRYWRRRANRRVRKVRRARALLRWSAIALVNLLIVGAVVLSGLRAVEHLTNSSKFTLRDIWVDGVERSSAPALRERLAPFIGENLLNLDLNRAAELAADDPWVREASVKRVLPHTLRVRVHERKPSATAVIQGLAHLVDTEGFVIGPCGPQMAEDLPVLTGLDRFEDAELAAALARGVAALTRLQQVSNEWAGGISELDLLRADCIRARMTEVGPIFLLDPERVERNVNQYLALRAEIEQRVGPAEYVDLRWRDRISVMPALWVSTAENR